MNIQISLGMKFHIEQAILNFWTKCAPKGYFRWKTKKENITIAFFILKLFKVEII